jgi:hypothetical protein
MALEYLLSRHPANLNSPTEEAFHGSVSSQPSTLRQQFLRGGRHAGGAVGGGNDLAQHRR